MGYARRMMEKNNPWLNFGLWVVWVVLVIISVIGVALQGHYSLWTGILINIACVFFSLLVLALFFVRARQQSYRNRYNAELELSKLEEWLLHAGVLFISVLMMIALLFAYGSFVL